MNKLPPITSANEILSRIKRLVDRFGRMSSLKIEWVRAGYGGVMWNRRTTDDIDFPQGFKVLEENGYIRLESENTLILGSSFFQDNNLAEFEFRSTGEVKNLQLNINDLIDKCHKKINEDDFSGAITNARALVESVLLEIKNKLLGDEARFDGDLLGLYKEVRKELNFDPSSKVSDDAIKQMLSGLINIVNGLYTLRNDKSDSHGTPLSTTKKEAKLCVNAAFTFCDFLYNSYLDNKS